MVFILGVLRVVVVALALSVFVVLSGCGKPTLEDDLSEYNVRLARVLEVDVQPWQVLAQNALRVRYPDTKERRLPTSDTRLGVFDFLSLDQCDLLHLISERNSSLGKVMSANAQYYYQAMIYAGIRQCIDILVVDGDPELVETLNGILKTKQKELPVHLWNATWGNLTYKQFYSFSKPLLDYSDITGVRSPAAESWLSYLQSIPTLFQVDGFVQRQESLFAVSQQSEGYLQPMEYHYAGRLIKTLVYAQSAVSAATLLLQQAQQQERPLCINQKASRKAEILNNVFMKFYVLKLQPALSQLDKEAAFLLQISEKYSPRQQIQNREAVIEFHHRYLNLANPSNPLVKLRKETKEHAMTWNKLLRSCGLRVGGQR